MNIEKQVCTLEQAKKLNGLDVAHKSQFHHFKDKISFTAHGDDYWPAFSVSELGTILPELCHSRKRSDGKWACFYTNEVSKKYHITNGNTEAESRAEMLIYLLENNLITAGEVNERLTA